MKKTLVKMIIGILFFALQATHTANAQGTVTFNAPWIDNGIAYFSLRQFDGMSFRVNPYPPQPHDDVMHVGATGPSGYPHNGTPYLGFSNTLGIPQFVVFAWTNAASTGQSFLDGAPFGLVSVDLADPLAPSLSPVSITFNGFRADGSMVSETFTTPGNGATTFETYSFGPDFAWGLTRVEIPSPVWAMDNIMYVPEPGAGSLFLLGLLTLGWRAAQGRRS
jgi:hypothetical protein